MRATHLKLVASRDASHLMSAQGMIDSIKGQARYFARNVRVHDRLDDPTAYQCDRSLLVDTWADLRRTGRTPEFYANAHGFTKAMAWMLAGLIQLRQARADDAGTAKLG